jgi:hypothetical protein
MALEQRMRLQRPSCKGGYGKNTFQWSLVQNVHTVIV